MAESERKRASSIQEMCKKFEQPSPQHSPSDSDVQRRIKLQAETSPRASKRTTHSQSPVQPRIETHWSKGKTQHNELIQKRQMQKQHLQKLSPEHLPYRQSMPCVDLLPIPSKPIPHSSSIISNGVPTRSNTSNDLPGSTANSSPGNIPCKLVTQRMKIFENSSNQQTETPKLIGNFSRRNVQTDQQSRPGTQLLQTMRSPNCGETYFSENPTYEEVPPRKPPRTFAHNRYIETRAMQPLPTNIIYGLQGSSPKSPVNSRADRVPGNSQNEFCTPSNSTHNENKSIKHPMFAPKPVFVDITATTLSPPKNYGTLKRSFSEEHVYADPYATIYAQRQQRNGNSKHNGHEYSEPYEDKNPNAQLHYLSSPIVGVNKNSNQARSSQTMKGQQPKSGKSSTPNVRDVINQTFGQLWRKLYSNGSTDGLDAEYQEDVSGDSGSEVSVKDVQERLIYVRSLKKKDSSEVIHSLSSSVFPDEEISKILGPCPGENSQRLFDGLTVTCLTPARRDSSPKPRLIFQYPKQIETIYQHTMTPQICFPDAGTLKISSAYKSETFLFAVEDEKGEKTFGYCLRLSGCTPPPPASAYITLPAVVCLLTSRNAAAFYLKVLLEVEKHLLLPESGFCNYIAKLYQVQVPLLGAKLSLPDYTEGGLESSLVLTRPSDNRLVNAELTLLLQRLEVDLLLKVIASLLLERRVLLTSSQSSTLFKCTSGVLSLLYPLSWQHGSIPVLPSCLLAQCQSQSPYLHGVLSMAIHKVLDNLKEKILIIDLDQGQTLREVGDEHTILPNRISKAVRYALSLAKNMTDPTEMMRDLMIAEAFIRMFVELLGHCDQHILENPSETYTFVDSFCKAPSSRSIQMFLQWFSETQMFEAFVEERLQLQRTRLIRNQPGFRIPIGLFDRRLHEYWSQQNQTGHRIRENVRGLGKKVRTFGEKLKKVF